MIHAGGVRDHPGAHIFQGYSDGALYRRDPPDHLVRDIRFRAHLISNPEPRTVFVNV